MPSSVFDFLDRYRYTICVVLVIVSILFIMFGHVYREDVQLVLKKEFCKFPQCSIDWWSVSHFALFAIFGFLIPEYPLSFFTVGLSFELLEDYLASDENTQLMDCNCPENKGKFWCSGIQDDYWYSNPSDPWSNLTGYIVGSALRTTFFAKK